MKLKRIIAIAAAALFTSVSVLANPMVTSARTEEDYDKLYWEDWNPGVITEIPIICSVPIDTVYDVSFIDYGHDLVEYPDMYEEEEWDFLKNRIDIWFNVGFNTPFTVGDVVTIEIPFSYCSISWNNNLEDYWDLSVNGDTATLVCLAPCDKIDILLQLDTQDDTSTEEDEEQDDTSEEDEDYQPMYWEDRKSGVITEIPFECNVSIDDIYDASFHVASDWYEEGDELYPDYQDMIDLSVDAGYDGQLFLVGDVVTIKLPFSYPVVDQQNGWYEYWDMSVDGDTVTLICIEPRASFSLYLEMAVPRAASAQDNFWFKPMENALAIAASEVEVNGGTAVAKATGDFALSYDIMKWLDEHPGVILEYTLNYKDAEHLIVIPGGGSCADPTIPWYGPEYLKKYYESR